MPVDTALHIAELDPTNPTGATSRKEADDNFRHIKEVLKRDFANVAGPVTASHTELNRLVGVTGGVQTQLDAKAPLASPALTGTPTAPTAAPATSTTQLASTAFVQAAIATVNAQTGVTLSVDSGAAISATAGPHIVCPNAGAVTVTLPSSPTAGQTVWITPGNGRTDTVIARNGQNIMGLAEDMTLDNANVTVQLRFINSTLGWRLV
jgi:hypothetical protein